MSPHLASWRRHQLGEFKTRFCSHEQSLRYKEYASSTALSKYITELKEKDINYFIKRSILKRDSA